MYTYYSNRNRIYQGDILQNVEIHLKSEFIDEDVEVKKREFPYATVMTQDCDLEQDFNNRESNSYNQRNRLTSILLCPTFRSDKLQDGIHLQDLGFTMERLNSKLWAPIRKNNDKRYYFLEGQEIVDDDEELIIPDLIIDFKHYQTIERNDLYNQFKTKYFISLDPLFREDISHRFSHYLSRIGLPTPKCVKCGYDPSKIPI